MEYLRDCRFEDLEELRQLSQTAYTEAFCDLLDSGDLKEYIESKYCMDNLKNEFEDKLSRFSLFCSEGKAVGYMKYILKPDSLEIERLYMLKSFKGLGAGSKLISKAEAAARENGKGTLTLDVLEINKPAISFYENKGFSQYSRGEVTIGKTAYALLLMKKELTK